MPVLRVVAVMCLEVEFVVMVVSRLGVAPRRVVLV